MKHLNIKNIIIGCLIVLVFIGFAAGGKSFVPFRVFNRSGEVTLGTVKIFSDTFILTTGNAYSVDLTAAGFTDPPRVHVTATRNTATANSVPNVALKSVTSTTAIINTTEGNPNTTTILGIPVLSGAPIQFLATPSDVTIFVLATGR